MSLDVDDVSELLRVREARGLRVLVVARILFALYGLSSLLWGGAPAIIVPIVLSITLPFIAFNAYLYRALRDPRRTEWVGWVGIAFDALVVLSYALIFTYAARSQGFSPAAMTKTPMIMVYVTFMVINSIALRPRYPIIVTLAAIGAVASLLVISLADERTVWSEEPYVAMTTAAVASGVFVAQMLFLLIGGAALGVVTYIARQTVIEAVQREAERARFQREQADLITESRVGALGKLVAGLSHEINSPLGAVQSLADLLPVAVSKLRRGLDDDGRAAAAAPGIERALAALQSGADTAHQATARIRETVAKLGHFAQLDRAERQRVDVHQVLDSTLALIPPQTVQRAALVRHYGDVPELICSPGRLNQLFITLLTNAFEAIDGDGTVTITTRADSGRALIDIADTGRGMAPQRLAHLFELELGSKGSRMAAALGLAACQSIVLQHGGEIDVESDLGRGTRFRIALPAAPPDAR